MDRISGLPDELIRLIVPYISAKDAAFLRVVSKRFRNLYTIIADLEFDDTGQFQGTFTDLVSRELARLETTTYIRRFSLKSLRGLDQARINHWLRDVLKCRGVMDLEMGIYGDNGYTLPLEIFTCKTVKKLKLGNEIVISVVPRNALLPALETLIFDSVRFCNLADCAFHAFLLACPVLKELTIDGMYWETWQWSGKVSSQSLQRLTIGRDMSEGFFGPDHQNITFDTPNLAYLDYTDFVPDGYTIVTFDSLVEAKLNLLVMVNRRWNDVFANDGDILSSNATNLIQGIRNVEILELSYPYTFQTLYFFRNAIPVFEKLRHLTMTHEEDAGFCWRFLPFLLNKTPNLKTLVIEGGVHYLEEPDYVCGCLSGYSCLLSCPLEVLELTLSDKGRIGELEQIKHFLGKLSRLELLKVHSRGRLSDAEKLRIYTDIQMFPRASSKCTIQLSCI
ncbi:F-box/LRR-repeat protein [Cardamine amara subsp. amara]|uniref:F-box/LRR-repeat protein n=1 Tax=Cardamine amara subsp. amara TaxID=228776 RepID=A0ABD0Z4Z0_CARAN